MRQRLIKFFAGRNGADALGRFVSWLAIILLVISIFTKNVFNGIMSTALWCISLVLLVYSYWRMLSKNVYKRSLENGRYLSATSGIRSTISGVALRFSQRKEYKFFKCPSCKSYLRVPRGKGKVQITCRKCGSRFTGKT